MSLAAEEIHLLEKLACGTLDGAVGDEREYRSYRSVLCGMRISGGVPIAYRQWQPASSVYDQVQSDAQDFREEKHYDTDEQKLEFLQRFGWLMDDEEAKAYSAKYKPIKKGSAEKDEDKLEGKILELELEEADRLSEEAVLQERRAKVNKAMICYLAICALSIVAVLLLGVVPSSLNRESKMWLMLFIGLITPCSFPYRYMIDAKPIKKAFLYFAQAYILLCIYVVFIMRTF